MCLLSDPQELNTVNFDGHNLAHTFLPAFSDVGKFESTMTSRFPNIKERLFIRFSIHLSIRPYTVHISAFTYIYTHISFMEKAFLIYSRSSPPLMKPQGPLPYSLEYATESCLEPL